ncbi:quorum-sensing-regulated virulence factor family protein [Pseudomonas tohonis]|uniref:quorum-sensing-regulated virulence factor family protein n=1 Tax=Pseudomonas tohonis TaxID=2725477 RepID=UPI001F1FC166|nr:quorum-sensing-regulated virulence factor family protein [Pseudomonas tohonis]
MSRPLAIALVLALPLTVQAASLKDFELTKMLEKVAEESSVGTPRAVNEDILDQGYTVSGAELVNHLSVREAHAAQMRANPDSMRAQLANSVCRNNGYRQLLARGAALRYEFSEYKTNRPISNERFTASDCGLSTAPAK